ncbi:TraR/DksA family transcriptional regulator [Vibrio parahaemolyticus]|uniref:TraR/DksA family transcriptional regulator n=1 Tax=Vibrio cholerae TaxID=666 RepID=A0A5Q6PKQ8_VIBCL|nr:MULTISPECIES: TraR/DksA family transcriptional regulator [Vibrio]EGR3229246.1 TraR/DksA family transcriptional regulator [Vibrio parahaemolyticus]EGR5928073.1 TraR/DksA family transcriptional regulator [Vibrio parahaemolyticus]EJG0180551.1 TraR/DksA family transcriptional regulator [Vibrio parahaemolyticus]KAA1255229.1 TraR/DksA family transcriptional regulator [Vibrio cholerae]MCS0114842.1 TraR/DksA family transcriptional regulator [Vibrio parahaemolyticus]
MDNSTPEMTNEMREAFRTRLIEEEIKVTNSRKAALEAANGTHEKSADQCDEASRIEDRNYHLAMADQQLLRLREIQVALKNFDDDFGYCIDCGDEINIKRLEINPAYQRCTSCEHDHSLRKKNG